MSESESLSDVDDALQSVNQDLREDAAGNFTGDVSAVDGAEGNHNGPVITPVEGLNTLVSNERQDDDRNCSLPVIDVKGVTKTSFECDFREIHGLLHTRVGERFEVRGGCVEVLEVDSSGQATNVKIIVNRGREGR